MPSRDEHVRQAVHNEKLAATLAQTAYLDWAATIYFYAAVHCVEALLSIQNVHSEDHAHRLRNMVADPNLRRIFKEYNVLLTMSRDARYDCYSVTPDDIAVVQQKFETIRRHITGLLGIAP